MEWGEGGLAGAWMALAEKRRGIMSEGDSKLGSE